ncbi:integrase arm-type DNA-binding domain-containing protein [Alkalilimnicola ehrlichii]|uniref:integrase arm-type DNA-binding domain-containing protein n=1 Tax=Alkalilimnicola ehrlichii TaxID=351052 RepID=UPI003BA0F9E9
MSKLKLTQTKVKAIEPTPGKQAVYWDENLTGFGLRVSPGGTKTFFFQGRLNGRAKKITIGKYGAIKAQAARDEAERIAAALTLGKDPTAQNKAERGVSHTLGDLLTAYVKMLEAEGKQSARAVGNCVTANIARPFPRLWKKPANLVSLDDLFDPIDRLLDAGNARQADKLRSYIKTAYRKAINARRDPKIPASMRGYGIRTNPIGEMEKVSGSSRAKDRALSLSEFRCYWQRAQTLPEPKRSIAMLHVLTGGQRQRQLARITLDDVDRDTPAMVIRDSKGKRVQPYRHVVPLLPEALALIDNISSGPYVFSASGGRKPMGEDYINVIAKQICEQMEQAGELEGAPFTGGTIRATVKTRLLKKPYRVSGDVLAYLQSHGLGTVDRKHYTHDDFIEEKLEALEKLRALLDGDQADMEAA